MAARDTMLNQLSGCSIKEATEFLCGDSSFCKKYKHDEINENINTIISHAKNKSHIMTISPHDESYSATNAKTGNKVKIIDGHAYAVIGAEDKYLFVKNPHDSTITLKLDINTFKNNFSCDEVEISKLIHKMKEQNNKQ